MNELDIQQERQAFEQRYKVNHNKVEYDEKRDCYEPLTHNKKTQWAYAKETNIRWGTWKSAKRHTLKSNNWISVEEGLPESNDRVLVLMENGIWCGFYDPMFKIWNIYGWNKNPFKVTHWQPLRNPQVGHEK